MSNDNTHEELFPLEETLCKDCVYRISRLIIPIDPEEFGLDEETVSSLGIEDGEEILLEQHTCVILNQDMDYLVVNCSLFKDSKDVTFFVNDIYK